MVEADDPRQHMRNPKYVRQIFMRLITPCEFDHGISGWKLGWSLAGPPLMTVFIFECGGTLFDSGLSHMGPEVTALAQKRGVEQVLLTHHHEDHSGNGARLNRELGIPVRGHELTARAMARPFSILPYQSYVWGKSTPMEIAPLPSSDWEHPVLGKMHAVHTPGHAPDHTVFHFPDTGVLVSGDLFLAERIKYFRTDEDVNGQVESLKRVMELDFDTLLCSHYPRNRDGKAALARKLDFLTSFRDRVLDAHGRGLTEKEILRELGMAESRGTQCFTFGDVSLINGVRSVIRGAVRPD